MIERTEEKKSARRLLFCTLELQDFNTIRRKRTLAVKTSMAGNLNDGGC